MALTNTWPLNGLQRHQHNSTIQTVKATFVFFDYLKFHFKSHNIYSHIFSIPCS